MKFLFAAAPLAAIACLSACDKPAQTQGTADGGFDLVAAENAPICPGSALSLALVSHDKTAGVQNWAFTNDSEALCALMGRPQVLFGKDGAPLPVSVKSADDSPKRVMLEPHKQATFTIVYPGAAKPCRPWSRMQILAPGNRDKPFEYMPSPEICGDMVRVSVVHGRTMAP